MLKDLGKLGWISNHSFVPAFVFSFLSRYARGNNVPARRMTRYVLENLRKNPPEPTLLKPFDPQNIVFMVWVDASVNKKTADTQLAVLIQMGDTTMIEELKEIGNYQNTVHAKSMKYRRVCRSTGQAELAALSLGVDEVLNLCFTLNG